MNYYKINLEPDGEFIVASENEPTQKQILKLLKDNGREDFAANLKNEEYEWDDVVFINKIEVHELK